eukprot:4101979-Pyramimonas_sp.AAC.1
MLTDARTNRPRRRLLIRKGVRQGSMEGPGLCIAVYDMIINDIGDQTLAAGFKGAQVQYDPSFQVFRNSEDFAAFELSVLGTPQIKFVDDFIALT